ncbi:hypothetical protein GF378_02655 [Candidatus Pacearchaeota archaeon]|nr:hypothetical protein [Candidatus Pacearchaeota archaeon]
MKNRKRLRKNWQLGFFGLFAIYAIPGIINKNWGQAIWLVWVLWFLYFIPIKHSSKSNSQ